jgi:hypothetical protein
MYAVDPAAMHSLLAGPRIQHLHGLVSILPASFVVHQQPLSPSLCSCRETILVQDRSCCMQCCETYLTCASNGALFSLHCADGALGA